MRFYRMRLVGLSLTTIIAAGIAALILVRNPGPPPAEVWACTFPPDVTTALFPDATPAVVVFDFSKRHSPFALPGEAFDATDLVYTGINRRLIWVKHRGRRWVIAYEQGGIGYSDHLLAYDLGEDGRAAVFSEDTAFPLTFCGVASALLDVPVPGK